MTDQPITDEALLAGLPAGIPATGYTEDDDELYRQKDSAELASEQGFTGTFAGLLEWLRESVVYGAVRVIPDHIDELHGNTVTRVELSTGGFSSDEHLLSRLANNIYMRTAWRSTHVGGLYVYEFNESWVTSTELIPWLAPEGAEPFEVFAWAKKVRLELDQREPSEASSAEAGPAQVTAIERAFSYGVELFWDEIAGTADTLVIRPRASSSWDVTNR